MKSWSCCYPAVPDRYLAPAFPYWTVTEEAVIAFLKLAKDGIEYKVHLMIWKTKGKNRLVDVETFVK